MGAEVSEPRSPILAPLDLGVDVHGEIGVAVDRLRTAAQRHVVEIFDEDLDPPEAALQPGFDEEARQELIRLVARCLAHERDLRPPEC